jgi:GNAT superfamily N-acetyltransferase
VKPNAMARLEAATTLHATYLRSLNERSGRVMDWPDLIATDVGDPYWIMNIASLVRTGVSPRYGDIAERLASFYTGAPGGGYIVFDHWRSDALSSDDFTVADGGTLMTRPPRNPHLSPPNGLTVGQALGTESLAVFGRIYAAAFGLEDSDEVRARRFAAFLAGDDRFRAYLGRVDGRPVCCAGAFISATGVYVDFVSTIADYRGRGYGRALALAATLADATKPALLHAGAMGRRIYESIGYRALADCDMWSRRTR